MTEGQANVRVSKRRVVTRFFLQAFLSVICGMSTCTRATQQHQFKRDAPRPIEFVNRTYFDSKIRLRGTAKQEAEEIKDGVIALLEELERSQQHPVPSDEFTFQESSLPSEFDQWVARFAPNKKPPREKLVELAGFLCDKSVGKTVAISPAFVGDDDDAGEEDTYSPHSNIVSWTGLSQHWFLHHFMETAEVQEFLKFGCRMWFVREYGIPELLRRRSVTQGPLIDHLSKFSSAEDRKPATAFVSFTGSYTLALFAELISQPELKDHYLWIDSFCVDQFAWNEQKNDAEAKAFKKGFMWDLKEKIQEIGYTALFLSNWDDPMACIAQIWVVFEIYLTSVGNATFSVILSESERQKFSEKVVASDDRDAFMYALNALRAIDVGKAKAFREEDKNNIFSVLNATENGIKDINNMVISRVRKWFLVHAVALVGRDEGPLFKKSHSVYLLGMLNSYADASNTLESDLAKVICVDPSPAALGACIRTITFLTARAEAIQGGVEKVEAFLKAKKSPAVHLYNASAIQIHGKSITSDTQRLQVINAWYILLAWVLFYCARSRSPRRRLQHTREREGIINNRLRAGSVELMALTRHDSFGSEHHKAEPPEPWATGIRNRRRHTMWI